MQIEVDKRESTTVKIERASRMPRSSCRLLAKLGVHGRGIGYRLHWIDVADVTRGEALRELLSESETANPRGESCDTRSITDCFSCWIDSRSCMIG